MTFDVYAIGDGQFIFNIFNAVAAIVGNQDFLGLLKLGMVLGVVAVGVQFLASGGKALNYMQIGMALLIYSFLIVPKVTTVIIDVRTENSRVVQNVPLGLGGLAFLTSNAGYLVTQVFETAFSGPSMTQEGFGSALETIKRVRMTTMNEHKIGMVNALSTGVNIADSWKHYIAECTFAAVTADNKSLTDLVNGPLEQELEYVSDTAGSEIMIGPTRTQGTCRDLFPTLRNFTHSQFLPELKARVIAPALGLAQDAGLVTAAVDNALDTLGIGDVSADDFIVTSYLIQPYFDAAAETYQTDFKFGYATMVNDAIRARNSQWSAQETIFERFMVPLMTFLEGFFYAVMPLIFFAAMLGFGGTALLGNSVKALLWLELWMPTMAVINYYIHSVVAGKLDALPIAGLSLASMSGVFQADDIVQTWLGNAGMLVSSVPVLAGVLLYGGAVSLQGLAGRIGGPDTILERQAAPSSFNPYAINNVSSVVNTDPVRGQVQAGAAEALATFSVGRQDQRAVESARRESSSATAAFATSLREFAGRTHGSEQSAVDSVRNAITSQGQGSQTYAAVFDNNAGFRRQFQDSHGLSDQEMRQVASTVGAQASLGISVGGTGVGGSTSLEERSANTSTSSSDLVAQAVRDLQQQFGENRQWQANVTNAVAHDISSDHQNKGYSGRTGGLDRDVVRRADDVVSADRSFSDAVSSSNSLGAQRTIDGATFARRIQSDERARGVLDRAVAELGLGGAVDRAMASGFAVRAFAGDRDAARIYTSLEALGGVNAFGAEMSGVEATAGKAALNEIYGKAFGVGANSLGGGAFDNEGVSGEGLSHRVTPADGAALVGREAGGAGNAGSAGRSVPMQDPVSAFESRFLPGATGGAADFFRAEVAPVERAAEDRAIAGASVVTGPNEESDRNTRERAVRSAGGGTWGVYDDPARAEQIRQERFSQAKGLGLPDWGAYYYAVQSTYGMVGSDQLTSESRTKLDAAREIVRGTFQTNGLPEADAQRFMTALDEAAKKDSPGAAPLIGQAVQMIESRRVDAAPGSPSARYSGYRDSSGN